jgi:hypothetical protein
MKLWHDFMHEFDNFQMSSRGKTYSDKTNTENSISTCWVHFESKGEIPHLHAAVSRVDINGKTNNDHNIHIRAQRAAEEARMEDSHAAALFVGLLSLDEAPVSSGGGGSSNNEGWRDKKDEDDVARANRCIHFAKSKVGVKKRTGRSLR